MTSVTVSHIFDLGTPTRPAPGLPAAMRVWRDAEIAELGHGDFAYAAAELTGLFVDQSRQQRFLLTAGCQGRCVGLAHVELPLTDNLHLASVEMRVAPAAEPDVVLAALWAELERVLTAGHRDTVIVWHPSPLPGSCGALTPRTGAGAVAATPTSRWLARTGFVLEQAELASLLSLPADPAELDRLWTEAETASAAYAIRQWVGPTPTDLQAAMAELLARMSTDVPLADLAMEPEAWTAARVRAEDAAIARMGREAFWSAAVERCSGRAVAYTCLLCPGAVPGVAYQEGTLVRADHRGHRLGVRVKVANLRLLGRRGPDISRVYTWNAHENLPMLEVNRRLGFKASSSLGCWQKNLVSP